MFQVQEELPKVDNDYSGFRVDGTDAMMSYLDGDPHIFTTCLGSVPLVLSIHYRIIYAFPRCLGFSNSLLLKQLYGPE